MVDIILRLMPIFILLSLIGFEFVKFQLPCDFNFIIPFLWVQV